MASIIRESHVEPARLGDDSVEKACTESQGEGEEPSSGHYHHAFPTLSLKIMISVKGEKAKLLRE